MSGQNGVRTRSQGLSDEETEDCNLPLINSGRDDRQTRDRGNPGSLETVTSGEFERQQLEEASRFQNMLTIDETNEDVQRNNTENIQNNRENTQDQARNDQGNHNSTSKRRSTGQNVMFSDEVNESHIDDSGRGMREWLDRMTRESQRVNEMTAHQRTINEQNKTLIEQLRKQIGETPRMNVTLSPVDWNATELNLRRSTVNQVADGLGGGEVFYSPRNSSREPSPRRIQQQLSVVDQQNIRTAHQQQHQSSQTAQFTPEQLTRLIDQLLQLQSTQQQAQRPPTAPTRANVNQQGYNPADFHQAAFPYGNAPGIPNLTSSGANTSQQRPYSTTFHQTTFPNGNAPGMPNVTPIFTYGNNRWKDIKDSFQMAGLSFPQPGLSANDFVNALEARALREGWTEAELLRVAYHSASYQPRYATPYRPRGPGGQQLPPPAQFAQPAPQVVNQTQNVDNIGYQSIPYPRGARPCFNCGIPGHMFEVCDNPRREVCNLCYGIGHTRHNCNMVIIMPENQQPRTTERPGEPKAQANPSSSQDNASEKLSSVSEEFSPLNQSEDEQEVQDPDLNITRVEEKQADSLTVPLVPLLEGAFSLSEIVDQINSSVTDEDQALQLLTQAVQMLENPLLPADEVRVESLNTNNKILLGQLNTDDDQDDEDEWEEEVDPGFEPTESVPVPPERVLDPVPDSPEQADRPTPTAVARQAFIPRIFQGCPLPTAIQRRLASRRKFISGTGPQAPTVTARIPVSIWIFGVKLNGILDTGSERSYINAKVYEDIKEYASGELRSDQTKRGILLANHTLCQSAGGAPFIIQNGSVAGEQYFSVLPNLGHSVVLGMDFALEFSVQIDCPSQTWKFKDSSEVHPFEVINCKENFASLNSITSDQEQQLQNFLEKELKKFEEEPCTGQAHIIEHEIVLKLRTSGTTTPW
ncbi:hypothetical protein KQX54_011336 [Cotesia glomerata]|uniref:CCHC-type domain-containing protein n=1 Tax=Cotesia glomerata TaxID=32391 RepID=A0AAV7HTG1_COTGL|nr:hypothetical protein KQX54_011336 [Cotesia glomerata]